MDYLLRFIIFLMCLKTLANVKMKALKMKDDLLHYFFLFFTILYSSFCLLGFLWILILEGNQ